LRKAPGLIANINNQQRKKLSYFMNLSILMIISTVHLTFHTHPGEGHIAQPAASGSTAWSNKLQNGTWALAVFGPLAAAAHAKKLR
jgi:hypothetical protein